MPVTLRIGTSGYSYKEWKGSFYPNDLPVKRMLRYYGEHFSTVESNSTFRRLPTDVAIKAWANEVPADFKFALKAPQQITHFRRLRDVEEPLSKLIEVTSVLKNRLGPILFQLPPNFKKDVPRLEAFLKLIPRRTQVAFEFRNGSWFDDEVFSLLKSRNVAICLAEAEETLTTPFIATADFGYVRLRMEEYSDAELDRWTTRIGLQKWTEAYIFFKHEDEANGPGFAKRMMARAKD
ncbi:MAG: hypothetical protein JWL86_6075 [Rhizobium sp.]|nr:hypothetical protein [Rhizobium sp.]